MAFSTKCKMAWGSTVTYFEGFFDKRKDVIVAYENVPATSNGKSRSGRGLKSGNQGTQRNSQYGGSDGPFEEYNSLNPYSQGFQNGPPPGFDQPPPGFEQFPPGFQAFPPEFNDGTTEFMPGDNVSPPRGFMQGPPPQGFYGHVYPPQGPHGQFPPQMGHGYPRQ